MSLDKNESRGRIVRKRMEWVNAKIAKEEENWYEKRTTNVLCLTLEIRALNS